MGMFQRMGMAVLMVGMLAVSARAQTLTVPDVLIAGSEVTISYSGGSPGGTITVRIDGPQLPVPQTVELDIELDQNGNGSTTWRVPLLWVYARFSAPGIDEFMRMIEGGSPL
jgi:hypothetical protein